MENSTLIPGSQTERERLSKYLLLIGLLLILVIAFIAYQTQSSSGTESGNQLLSQTAFAEQYGLQVRLIGVTGGGGMVDFRLKMIDAGKARQFLQDPDHLPIMLISENGRQILAADSMDEDIQWNNGGILFMMLPNSESLIQSGSPVIVKFGDTKLEAISAQ